jgi:hypothetical protein
MKSKKVRVLKSIDELEKALPPKLAYRFRRWLRRFHQGILPSMRVSKVERIVLSAFEDYLYKSQLKKHDVLFSKYENGEVRFDFGSNVSEKIKKAAIAWAKKRGLKVVESSLQKSIYSTSYIILKSSNKISNNRICIERLLLEF